METVGGQERLISCAAVAHKTALSRTTIWRKVQQGTFPKPLKLSIRRIAWREREVDAWIASLTESEPD